jgi:phosphoglycolate phosphatase
MEKLILFDFDGVIVDSLNFYEEMVNRCLKELGSSLRLGRREYLEIFDDNFYNGLRKKGVDVEAFMKVSRDIAPSLPYEQVKPAEGLLPVIEELARRHRLVIVSSNSTPVIRRMLSLHSLGAHFLDVLGLEFTLSKIEKIRHAMVRYETGPDCTYYVGDTAGDIGEAKEAGVRTVAVTWGWHTRDRLTLSAPDLIIDSPDELLQL